MKTQLLTTLENAKNYTLGLAGSMPEKNYDFKPAPAVWTFGELLHHIGYGIGSRYASRAGHHLPPQQRPCTT